MIYPIYIYGHPVLRKTAEDYRKSLNIKRKTEFYKTLAVESYIK